MMDWPVRAITNSTRGGENFEATDFLERKWTAACVGKGFLDYFEKADADVFCIQESKLQAGQIELDLPGYHQYWNYAEKKGYSGTAMFTKEEPLSVTYGLGIEEHDHEGRVITAEFLEYYVVTCYTPNSQDGLARLDYRMHWRRTSWLIKEAGGEEAGYLLRGFKCSPPGD